MFQPIRSVHDLPDEVLEFILSYIPPYKDLEQCMLVNKRWYRSAQNVKRATKNNLNRAISDFNIRWTSLRPLEMAPTITKRYCHSACIHGNSMYVFGGCTSASTTFNDLWRLDLSKRQWIRPLTMGTYPSPKACATLACHKDTLILFGGWTHPSPYPLHQAWRLFNELHIYNITTNCWTAVNNITHPPPTAGHSVTVHGDHMVLFGGLQKTSVPGQYSTSNDVWCLDLLTFYWHKQKTTSVKPVPRYGHSQIVLDEKHILIIGGCGGPNSMYHDVWILELNESGVWKWEKLQVRNKQWAPPQLWCNPACQIGNKIVVLSRSPDSVNGTPSFSAKWNVPAHLRPNIWVPPIGGGEHHADIPDMIPVRRKDPPVPDRDENVNGRRGRLNNRHANNNNLPSSSSDEEIEPVAGPSGVKSKSVPDTPKENLATSPLSQTQQQKLDRLSKMESPINLSAFLPDEEKRNRNRERQLASLRKMEERIKNLRRNNENQQPPVQQQQPPVVPPPVEVRQQMDCDDDDILNEQPKPKKQRKHVLGMYVMDISQALASENAYAAWLPWKSTESEIAPKTDGPEETILYTLVPGKGELVMFGGIQKDGYVLNCFNCLSNCISNVSSQVSNSLHFITAPRVQI